MCTVGRLHPRIEAYFIKMGNKQASSSERAGQKPSEESKNESTIPGETDESKETAIRKAEVMFS